MTTITFEVDERTAETLAQAAAARKTSVTELVAEVTYAFVAEEQQPFDDWSPEDVEAIEEGITQLRRGEKTPQDEVMARIRAKHGW